MNIKKITTWWSFNCWNLASSRRVANSRCGVRHCGNHTCKMRNAFNVGKTVHEKLVPFARACLRSLFSYQEPCPCWAYSARTNGTSVILLRLRFQMAHVGMKGLLAKREIYYLMMEELLQHTHTLLVRAAEGDTKSNQRLVIRHNSQVGDNRFRPAICSQIKTRVGVVLLLHEAMEQA